MIATRFNDHSLKALAWPRSRIEARVFRVKIYFLPFEMVVPGAYPEAPGAEGSGLVTLSLIS